MTTSWETTLRQDLRELADAPGPPSLADQALADARKVRRWRAALAGASAMTLTALIAIPLVVLGPAASWSLLPFGAPGADTPCETATDEAEPRLGVPVAEHPNFVRVVISKLPPRDDYSLQSASGTCVDSDALPGAVVLDNAYAVINLGPNREHGHLTVDLYHQTEPITCATQPRPPEEVLFCEDATATTPLVMAANTGSPGYFVVTAIYPDARTVSIGSITTPFDVATIQSVVTDPALADLLS